MSDDPERDPHLDARFAALDVVDPPDVWRRVAGAPLGHRRRRRVLLVAAGILLLAGIAVTWTALSSPDEGSVDIGPSGPADTAPISPPSTRDDAPSTTTSAPPIPAVAEFLDEPALIEFFERFPDIHTFDRPGPVLLVLVEPGFGTTAEALDHPAESVVGVSVWPQESAWLAFQEAMADRPDLVASIRMGDMPHGIALHPRFADTPFAQLAEPYLAQEGVIGVVPLYDQPPDVTYDAPPGWELLATVDEDIERSELAVMSGSSLVAWTAQGLLAVDGQGTVRTGESGPFPAEMKCCLAVGTEDSVVVLGSEAGSMAAAVVDTDSLIWRRLEDPPVDGSVRAAAALDDGEIVVLTVNEMGAASGGQGQLHALDPVRDRWRAMPLLPSDLGHLRLTSDGSRLVVTGIVLDGGAFFDNDDLRVLELVEDEWRELDPPPIGAAAAEVMPEGTGLVALNYSLESAWYDGEEWTSLPELPLDPSECQPIATITDVGVVAHGCSGLIRFDGAEARWEPIPGLDADWRHWGAAIVGRDRLVGLEATSDESTLVFVRTLDDTN